MKKKTVVICTIMVLLSVSVIYAQTETIPEARSGHSMVEIDGLVYMFGGENSTSKGLLNDLWKYSDYDSKWESVTPADPPSARKGHATATRHDTMYIYGGYTDDGVAMDVWGYDPVADGWTEIQVGGAIEPEPREYHSATTVGDNVYICGGLNAEGSGLGDLWRHTFSTGLWELREDYLGACSGHASFEYDGFLYIFGGYDPEYASFRNDMWFFDPAVNDWDYVDAIGALPSERAFFAAAQDTMGNLLVFGGRNEIRNTAMSDNFKFDVSTLTWTQLADGPAISDAAAVYINETSIYLFGGLDEFGDATNELWKYNPSTDTWEEIVGIDDHEIIAPSGISLFTYPNPFNPTTAIKYELKTSGYIELKIFNIKGELVSTLVKDDQTIGNHSVIWNGNDDKSNSVSSGVYFYKLNVNGKTEAINKCLLLK